MTKRLSIGISTCPNDTFTYHGLLSGATPTGGLELEFRLADIEELNEAMARGELDVAKVSAHAALELGEAVRVLPVGWALGFGVGPVVLAPGTRTQPSPGEPLVLAPGARTTATLLWRLFHPEPVRLEQRVFSEILPALERGEADLGVCIHEGRFTYEAAGLRLVEDLGERWERSTELPLPLGGLVARSGVDLGVLGEFVELVRASLRAARADEEAALPTMRRHAQEASDAVLFAHVDLYVNAFTEDLRLEGRAALDALAERAVDAALLPPGTRLSVL